jgi:hypothetical protein
MGTPAPKTSRINMLGMVGRKDFIEDCVPADTVYTLNVQV